MSAPVPSDDDQPVVDIRLAVPALTAWAVCFVSTSVAARWSAIACAAGVLLGLAALLVRRRAVLAMCVALVAAAASGGLHVAALAAGPLPALARAQQRVAVDVTVATDPSLHAGKAVGSQLRPDLVILRGTVTALTVPRRVTGLHSPVLMLVTWRHGAVDGAVAQPAPGRRRQARAAAAGRRHHRGAHCPRTARSWSAGPVGLEQVAGAIRSGLRRAVAGQSADVRGLLPGLVLGDVSRMDPTLTDDFRTAGLTHLVAVSGANVAICSPWCWP